MTVDLANASARLFDLHAVHRHPGPVAFEPQGPDVQLVLPGAKIGKDDWISSNRVRLDAPIMTWRFAELAVAARVDALRETLRRWTDVEYTWRPLRKIGLATHLDREVAVCRAFSAVMYADGRHAQHWERALSGMRPWFQALAAQVGPHSSGDADLRLIEALLPLRDALRLKGFDPDPGDICGHLEVHAARLRKPRS
jgi:hypothetical protein